MATVEDRYKAATAYVRRAIDAVKPSAFYWINPVTGAASWYAGHEKTRVATSDLERIEDRWLLAKIDDERAKVARDAELLADRIQESLPGAPQDRVRTNLYAGEPQKKAEATSYLGEVSNTVGDAWNWLKKTASDASEKASTVEKWLVIGGGGLLAWKALDYLSAREHNRVRLAASDVDDELNTSLEEAAEQRDAQPDSTGHFHVLTGLAGAYMPNDNQVYATRTEAEDAAREIAEDFREQGERVEGSAESGYYAVGDNESIEITDCDERDCLRDLDEP
jgi:hypothetical protein